MDRARDDLFSRPAFAGDPHRGAGGGDLLDHRQKTAHGFAAENGRGAQKFATLEEFAQAPL